MKITKALAVASTTGVLLAGLATSPAFAWHPQGAIVKYVQNQTQKGAISDANDAAHAVSANPGDTLLYTIVVSNNGAADSRGYNDMASTVMTDTLPAGVALVSNPSQTKISESLGTIKPGQSVTKTYAVKVTSNQDGSLIQNQACFTGNSTANDNPQKGCDVADVKVNVPKQPPVTPTTPAAPAAPAPEAPAPAATLPNTGAGNFVLPAVLVSIAGYAAYLLRLKRRAAKQS